MGTGRRNERHLGTYRPHAGHAVGQGTSYQRLGIRNWRDVIPVGLPARTVDAMSPGQPSAGDSARLRRRQAVIGLTSALTLTLVALTAGCGQSSAPSAAHSTAPPIASVPHASNSSGGIRFPPMLLGLQKNTSAPAQQVVRSVASKFNLLGFSHTQAAIYGIFSTSNLFAVGVTELSAAYKKYGTKLAATTLRRGFLSGGSTDSQAFPARSSGAGLVCGHLTRGGTTEITCIRYDKKDIGIAIYFDGFTSSLNDAAAKTDQAMSVIGG